MISVLIVDDEQLVQEALKLFLKDAEGIKIVAKAETGETALTKAREKKLNVVLLDLHLPDISGMNVVQKLLRQSPETKILLLPAKLMKPFLPDY